MRPERNPVGLVLEWRGDVDACHHIAGKRHADRAVMFELAAMVAKVAGETRPSTIAPLPVEAP